MGSPRSQTIDTIVLAAIVRLLFVGLRLQISEKTVL